MRWVNRRWSSKRIRQKQEGNNRVQSSAVQFFNIADPAWLLLKLEVAKQPITYEEVIQVKYDVLMKV